MPSNPRFTRAAKFAVCLAVAAALCWAYPPIRIVRIDASKPTSSRAALSASTFWDEQLVPAAKKATDAKTLLAEIHRDPKSARQKYGRSVGLGGSCYFFLAGSGRVLSKRADAIEIQVDPAANGADLVIDTRNVFGNAIRDGCGLLNINTFPNSRDYNDLSAALNQIVETRVFPMLNERAVVGAELTFGGVCEVDDDTDLRGPLHVILIFAEAR